MRNYMDSIWGRARQMVDDRRARDNKRECMIDTKLDEYNKTGFPMSQHAFNNLFGELMEAGADTTANQILTLILALAKNPQVQEKARREIDMVCGTDRAPLFSDFSRLPYVNAIVKEGLRWRPTFVSPGKNRIVYRNWLSLTYQADPTWDFRTRSLKVSAMRVAQSLYNH
jgi:cytochrome P450